MLHVQLENDSRQYAELKSELLARNPHYAQLVSPVTASLAEIQSRLLGPDTLLLEYFLGEDHSYLWALTQDSVQSFSLPPENRIEAASWTVYELLTARNAVDPGESPAHRRHRILNADLELDQASASLSGLLLDVLPAELRRERLIFVPDGILNYIPFGALPTPVTWRGARSAATGDSAGRLPPLLALEHDIVYLPSAGVLEELTQSRHVRFEPKMELAVVADPVFQPDDPRVLEQARASRPGSDESREDQSADQPPFTRLRFSRLEANEIARLVPPEQRLVALDFAASRATIERADLSRYRFIHFATHAVLDTEHPESSGIVLSRVDTKGRPVNGFLRLADIFNLHLNADTVVLSSCRTALGKDIEGEGVIGLTRGFLYAGASSVMASLWRIQDRATAFLMNTFYTRMLDGGFSPAAALRAAQTAMQQDPQWKSPYYWAAFTLQGLGFDAEPKAADSTMVSEGERRN
ncbi:MAG: CHAT domain-containing protein [Acidobacteriota bacterium]